MIYSGFVFLPGAGAAFGLDLAHGKQRALGQGRAYQLIHQHAEQHHIPGQSAVGQGGSGDGHAQSNASLGQQRDAQVVGDELGLTGEAAAEGCTALLACAAGNDVKYAHQQRHRLGQHV